MTWDVWAELRRRPHVTLEWADLGGDGGRIDRHAGGWTIITLDYRLMQRERRAALAHELVHEERGILFDADTPVALIDKEESAVRREVAWRLCPPVELARRIRHTVDNGQPVTAQNVCEWFDVPVDVALEAMRSHELAASRTRHPTARAALHRNHDGLTESAA